MVRETSNRNWEITLQDDDAVESIIFYEWMQSVEINKIYSLFQKVAEIIDIEPDLVDLIGENSKSKTYNYGGRALDKALDLGMWRVLAFNWLRDPAVRSTYAIHASHDSPPGGQISLHVDLLAVPEFPKLRKSIEHEFVHALSPLYGMKTTMPYFRGPDVFVHGVNQIMVNEDISLISEAEERHQARNKEFASFQFSHPGMLRSRFRDVFHTNYISRGHLDLEVEGESLDRWIIDNRIGVLEKIGDVTWRWNLDDSELTVARNVLLTMGYTAVKS